MILFPVEDSSKKSLEWFFLCLGLLSHQAYPLFQMPPQKRHNIVAETVQVYAHLAQVVVKAHVKDAKEAAKMDANLHVGVVVDKVAKAVVTQCVKVIALQDVKSHVTVSVANRA